MSRYIEEDATLSTIKKYLYETAMNNFTTNRKFADACEEIAEHRLATWIDAIPTADVRKNVHGVWAWHEDEYICNCSRCDFEIDAEGCINPEEYVAMYKFCPNCGADMRKGETNG